jgi:hypothetical protein
VAALVPLPPKTLKAVLEAYGFAVEEEDDFNWALHKEGAPRPVVIVPKDGELVSLSLMMGILDQLNIDNGTYFNLLNQVNGGAA